MATPGSRLEPLPKGGGRGPIVSTARIDGFLNWLGYHMPAPIASTIAILTVLGLRLMLGRESFAVWLTQREP